MAFYNKYPYTDFHELNLDAIIEQVKRLQNDFDEFALNNSLTYMGEWDITKSYPAFSVVDDGGFGFLSLQPVPPGVLLNNPDYWLMIVDFSALYNDFGQRITDLETTVGDASSGLVKDVDDLETTVGDASSGLVKDVDDLQNDMTTAQNDIATLQAAINAVTVIYDTLTSMLSDTDLVSGKYVKTLARSTSGDNGGSYYHITDTVPTGYYETLSNGLYAKPIGAHNVLVFGVIGSGDETSAISTAISEIDDYIEFNPETYTISGELVFTQDIIGNGAKIKVEGDVLTAILTPGSVKGLEVYSDDTAHVRVGIAVTSANSVVEDCYVHDLYNDDVSTPNHSVYGITFDNTDRNGCVIARRNRVSNIVGTYLVSQTVYSAAGIVYSGYSDVLIENNIVTNIIDAYNGDCLSVIPKVNDGTLVCVIRDNYLCGGQIDGMKVSFNGAQIYGNTIRYTGLNPRTLVAFKTMYGIRVQEGHEKIHHNNIIDDTSVVGDYTVGIIGYHNGSPADDIDVSYNNIEGCRIQIYLAYYAQSRVVGNYTKSGRSDTTVLNNAVSNTVFANNTIVGGADISNGGISMMVSDNQIKGISFDMNLYTSKHIFTGNVFDDCTIAVPSNSMVNGNMFLNCTNPLTFTGSGNMITNNRFVDSTVPTIPAGNTDDNNV